jgi:hypothetical protein
MPAFGGRSVVEIARGVEAFLELHARLMRGDVPGSHEDAGAQRGEAREELRRARGRLER